MRPTKSQGDAKALRVPNGNISAEFARRLRQRQRENIRRDDNQRARVVPLPDEIGVVINCAIGGGILDECAKGRVVEFEARIITDLNLNPERFRSCLDDGDRLRVAIIGDEKSFSIGNNCVTKRHRFGGGSGFVQQ